MVYITLEEVKKFLNITGTEQDEILQNMISLSKNMIDDSIGGDLGNKDYEEYIRTPNSDVIFLSKIPKNLSVKSIFGESIDFIRTKKNAVYFKERQKKDLIVKYVSGFDEVPFDIKELSLNLVKNARKDINSKEDLAIKSKKIDTLSITYFSKKETEKGNPIKEQLSFDKIIRKYKSLFYMRVI